MSLREDLIGLYCGGKVDFVEQEETFKEICSKYQKTEGYEAERQRIRCFKKNLEDLCEMQTNDTQVRFCLKLLSCEKNERDRLDYHLLITRAYRIHWSDAQKEHFDNAYTIIQGEVYFFLSFTTRTATPKYVSKVNKDNWYFLEDVFFPDKLTELGDVNRKNMLAEAIWRYLRDQGLSGFYFLEHEGESDSLNMKLRDNCKKALVFLQLVQGVMFEYKIPNFCHFEYRSTCESGLCRKRIFVMGEERGDILARKNDVFRDWLPWYEEITNDVDALELIPTRYRDDVSVKKNHEALKYKVVRQIERIRDELFKNIPV